MVWIVEKKESFDWGYYSTYVLDSIWFTEDEAQIRINKLLDYESWQEYRKREVEFGVELTC